MPPILISWPDALLNLGIILGSLALVKPEGLSNPEKFYAGSYL